MLQPVVTNQSGPTAWLLLRVVFEVERTVECASKQPRQPQLAPPCTAALAFYEGTAVRETSRDVMHVPYMFTLSDVQLA